MTTTPSSGPSQTLSSARAICAAPLPAPITTVLPFGLSGRRALMPVSGSAARTAASNRPFRKSRGAVIVIGGLCCLGVDGDVGRFALAAP
ncbi:hypothetical protein ACVIRM_002884 [Rhizobium laguerreae]